MSASTPLIVLAPLAAHLDIALLPDVVTAFDAVRDGTGFGAHDCCCVLGVSLRS